MSDISKKELINEVENAINSLPEGFYEQTYPWTKKVAPSSKEDKYLGGIIENWWPNCNDSGEVLFLSGYLYKDGRWSNGTGIRTSYIVDIVYDEQTQTGFAETRNTVYTLGKKWSKE